MASRTQFRSLLLLSCAALMMIWSSIGAAQVPVVTGEHWTRSTVDQKKAYLIGIANLIQVEIAYYAANPPADGQNFVPRFAKGLQGQTLDSVRDALDKWYANNPGQQQRAVIETIWFELVVPGLQKAR
jgi:hypothetical protein